MAFAKDFDHLSLQMGNIEHKQEQNLRSKLSYRASMLWLCYQLVSARPLFMRSLSTGDRNQTPSDRGNRSSLQHHRRPDSVERLTMVNNCLREEREFVKGNGFKQVLSH